MKLKNFIPYTIAHQIFEYESKYITSIIKGYNKEIQTNIINNDYYLGELDIVYYMAINHRRNEIIDFFESEKIKINKTKKVFVYESAKMNYHKIVENYLINKKPNKKSKFLFLLLEIATLHSSSEVVDLLLNYGVDFKQKHYSCIRTVLSGNNFNLFKIFHKYGLDIKKNEYIYSAIAKDNKEWFNYLLNNGFEINDENKNIIYNFLGFNGSLNIIEDEKSRFIDEKNLMLKASNYNPISKKWFETFYKQVDFYLKLDKKLVNKGNSIKTKINKI